MPKPRWQGIELPLPKRTPQLLRPKDGDYRSPLTKSSFKKEKCHSLWFSRHNSTNLLEVYEVHWYVIDDATRLAPRE